MKSKFFGECENEVDAVKRFNDSFSFTITEINRGVYLPNIQDIIEVKEFDVRLEYVGSAQQTVSIFAENKDEAIEIADEEYGSDESFDDWYWEHQYTELG